MNDKAWITGYSQLEATMRDRALTPAMAAVRGDCYRQALNHLSDEEWAFAIDEAIRTLDWFPTIHELLDCAEGASQLYLPPARRTEAEREEGRRSAAAGLDAIKARYVEAAEKLPPVPVASPPTEAVVVMRNDARDAELARQKAAILADGGTR